MTNQAVFPRALHDTSDFLESLSGLSSQEDRTRCLETQLRTMGVSSYAYLRLLPTDREVPSFFATTYPREWVRRYRRNGYVRRDPVLAAGRRRRRFFEWDIDQVPDDTPSRQLRVMRQAAEFGLYRGLAVPVHGFEGEFDCLVVPFQGSAVDLGEFSRRDGFALQITAFHFHNSLKRMPTGSGEAGIGPPPLSRLQADVLGWTAAGKAPLDVAQILSLDEWEVRMHIYQAARRLKTFGPVSTVAKAIAMGLLRP
ncbi:MAG: autoinducer binding domain-containing protein [Sphingomonadales bacterium]|nr:autoinducer binding domain-containing protein [Sphingomonadales bacterium]